MIIIIICFIFIFFWNQSFLMLQACFILIYNYWSISTWSWDIKILIWSVIVSDKYFATFDKLLIHITNIWGFTFVAYNIYLFQLFISPPHIGNTNIYLQISFDIHLFALLWWNDMNTYFKTSDGKYLATDQEPMGEFILFYWHNAIIVVVHFTQL